MLDRRVERVIVECSSERVLIVADRQNAARKATSVDRRRRPRSNGTVSLPGVQTFSLPTTSARPEHLSLKTKAVLFVSRPRSEGWPHHGRTISVFCLSDRVSSFLTAHQHIIGHFSAILIDSSTESPGRA